jgi:hypothetical protein
VLCLLSGLLVGVQTRWGVVQVAREFRVVCAGRMGYDYRYCWLERWGLLMAPIVAVHGIGQQLKGPRTLKDAWLPTMRDGLALAGAAVPAPEDLVAVFLGLPP